VRHMSKKQADDVDRNYMAVSDILGMCPSRVASSALKDVITMVPEATCYCATL
jgi:hypothetical protein